MKDLREKYPFKPYQLALLGKHTVEAPDLLPGEVRFTGEVAPVWHHPPGYDPAAPTTPEKAGLGAFPTEPVGMDPVDLSTKIPPGAVNCNVLQPGTVSVDPDNDEPTLEQMQADYEGDYQDPEPVDPDSVDGLIARLQALPPDVRKLKVYVVVEDMVLTHVTPQVLDANSFIVEKPSVWGSKGEKVVVL